MSLVMMVGRLISIIAVGSSFNQCENHSKRILVDGNSLKLMDRNSHR